MSLVNLGTRFSPDSFGTGTLISIDKCCAMHDCFLCFHDSHTHKYPPPLYTVYHTEYMVVLYNRAFIFFAIIVAEAVSSKGDSLDVYMKSVKEKVDKGAMYDIKLQISKLKKVNASMLHSFVFTWIIGGN